MLPLEEVIAAVEAEGRRLRAEFYAPQGPRGRRGNCPADAEIEARLRSALLALLPCCFIGEETPAGEPTPGGEAWIVDPHDGTFEFLSGRRGSAISVGLVRSGVPVLGVVHAPDPPDRGPDTIAWAEGCGPMRRNGVPIRPAFAGPVWATASSAFKPQTWSRATVPERYVAMPSVAYRLARVAAGDGVATVSTHALAEYDVAGGLALIRAAGGVMLDAEGKDVVLTGKAGARISGCYAGARDAVRALAAFRWAELEAEPRRELRVAIAFPRRELGTPLLRAQGCLVAHLAGDSLGSQGAHKTLPGQPTDDGEMTLTLARALVRDRGHDAAKVLDGYRAWLTSRPVEVGQTTEKGLLGTPDESSQSNGSLMRVSPIGVFAAGDPALAARLARDDSALTHPNEVCLEACAGYCAAIATLVGGATRDEALQAAITHAKGPAREAIERGYGGTLPADFHAHSGWALIALQNAFYCLASCTPEAAVVQTISRGGDTDTNAAIAGALAGAYHGRDAIPPRWILDLLACRPLPESGALRPRPMEYWPDDLLELAEALLEKRGQDPFQEKGS